MSPEDKKRWIAFATLCLGDLMIVLDSTVVNVALPSIRQSLAFSEASLVWVVNGYILTYGGFMLLGGRLGDLYGERRLFLIGVAAFTIASLVCGVSTSQTMLVVARAIQGVGGAVVTAVAVALIMRLFPEGPERVKAMGYFGFIGAGGGSVGLILGGLLTDALNWRWIFLINLPVGIAVTVLSFAVLAPSTVNPARVKLDVAGAVTVTASILAAVYAIVGGNEAGWLSGQTVGLLVAAGVLMAAFLVIESRVEAPLAPLNLFKLRNVATANIVAVLWAAGMFAWFFLAALYLQLVLGYDPMHVGLAFLPGNLIMAAFSLRLSAAIVNRFGIRGPAAVGLALAALGLLLFGFAPVAGDYWIHVFPAMALLGVGGGMAFNPLMLAAMNDVPPEDSGLASGVLNTGFMMGGALGLAGLAAVAAARTERLGGPAVREALNGGYQTAFLVSAVCVGLGAALCWLFIRAKAPAEAVAVH